MRLGRALHFALLSLVLLPLLPAHAATSDDPVARGLAYLAPHATETGFAARYATEAVAAAGLDPARWPTSADSVLAAIAPDAGDADTTYYAQLRVAYAAASAGYDPHDVDGHDYVADVRAGYKGAQFGNPAYLNDDAWAILALRAANVPASDPEIQSALLVLDHGRARDGGWSHYPAQIKSETDMTGMVLAALASAGRDITDDPAVAMLASVYDGHGGFGDPQGWPSSVNVQHTVWALHGRAAAGLPVEPESVTYLLGKQNADGGWPVASGRSNDFATAEVVTFLAGGRHPLPGWAPLVVTVEPAPAREPTILRVGPPFVDAKWSFDEGAAQGANATFTFAHGGVHEGRVVATGAGRIARGDAVAVVPSARPIVRVAASEVEALRRAPVVLDVNGSWDPDGRIVAWRVEWGDGNATGDLAHAYPLPGDYAVNVSAQDDGGAWSPTVRVLVYARNRAPEIAALPARIVADRAHDVTLDAGADDADGDAVALSWSYGGEQGEGAPLFRPRALGIQTLALSARDAYGGVAHANVTVDVVDLAPRLANLTLPGNATEDDFLALRVNAWDPDDAAPRVSWSVDGASIATPERLRLPAGAHEIRVVARDAEGLAAQLDAPLVVRARDAAPESAPVAPSIQDARASFLEGALVVAARVAPEDAEATVRWESDAGPGSAPFREGQAIPLPGATRVRAWLDARHDGLLASQPLGDFEAAALALSAPEATLAASAGVDEPLEVRLTLPEGASEARVRWGDGEASAWSNATEATHAWRAPGTYVVRVEARAADGRVSGAARDVTILPRVSERLAPAAVTPAAEAALRKEAPGAGLPLLLLALLAAATRRTR